VLNCSRIMRAAVVLTATGGEVADSVSHAKCAIAHNRVLGKCKCILKIKYLN